MYGNKNKNLSGNELYNTNFLTLLEENMLCSNLHCQKGLDLIPFAYKIGQARAMSLYFGLGHPVGNSGAN